MSDIREQPYAQWLEDCLREMVEIAPTSIAMQMIGADGKPYTCYWRCSTVELAIIMAALRSDEVMEWAKMNRGELAALLSEDFDEDEDDGLQESDTETDREG